MEMDSDGIAISPSRLPNVDNVRLLARGLGDTEFPESISAMEECEGKSGPTFQQLSVAPEIRFEVATQETTEDKRLSFRNI